ncbi:T9SS type B sorting domain-containing protein [Labilibacter marinus]|uniref:T9SS type B sorting domain-containing protein n=1 Tax=Labilibacter marinus TaxID=1477105 RepID=UPI000950356F|nr:gliding motility-associated C-terminal domain-containing protein [Labilibacter marinus]
MVKRVFVCIVLLGIKSLIVAQSSYLINPSFEGAIGQGIAPRGWFSNNNNSSPDTQPYDVRLNPSDGNSFMGLVMRGQNDPDPKNEDACTQLLKPLLKGNRYLFAADIALSTYIFDVSNGDTINYDNPCQIKISGGKDQYSMDEVLLISELATDSVWYRHNYVLAPQMDTCHFIKIEIYLDVMKAAYILIDNLALEEVEGIFKVCPGEQGVTYNLPLFCHSANSWTYTGNGAALYAQGDMLKIDFDDSATSGQLVLNNTCPNTINRVAFDIEVPPSIRDAGLVIGDSSVCVNQNGVIYAIDSIKYADSYTWEYSGTGVQIEGSSNKVVLNFNHDATSGNLWVTSQNKCFKGPQSLLHPINIESLPDKPEIISGDLNVCPASTELSYMVPALQNSNKYQWDYTGTGVTIHGDNNQVKLDFDYNATHGLLSVMGENMCGLGIPSEPLSINIIPLPADASEIIGKDVVCPNENSVSFSVPSIPNTDNYLWEYDGQGATIIGDENAVMINFLSHASSGNLMVSGINRCGSGGQSLAFPIYVNPYPEKVGDINGKQEVCYQEMGVNYSVELMDNTISYEWAYTDSETKVLGTSNGVSIDFNKASSDGFLSVKGINGCGAGPVSSSFPISIFSCNHSEFGINIPNSFTPNGDDINEYFVIRGITDGAQLIIVDGLGKTVYKADSYNSNWNGYDMDGVQLPTNTYWYFLTLSNASKVFKGYVYLKR